MLRSTFMGFDIAKRGIQVSQKGLDITGQNMVNWDSQGYTRQRIDQVALSQHTYRSRYSSSRIGQAGQGVDIAGVGQIRDTFLDKLYRDESSESGYFDTVQNILSNIEASMGEFNPLTNAGIRGSLETLIGALQDFSGESSTKTNANIISTEFKNLCLTLQQLSTAIDKTALQQKYDLEVSVYEVNEKLQELANLNYTIAQNKGVSVANAKYGPNELLDRQNLLLDELSQFADIDVTRNADYTVTVSMGGQTVVLGDKSEKLEYVDNGDSTVALRWVSTGESIKTTSGALKGYTDFINGRGPNQQSKNESPYKGILYYKDQLDIFANTLVHVVNNSVPDSFDAAGNVLTYKELLGGVSDVMDPDGHYPVITNGPITAANIAISDIWANDSDYIIAYPDSKKNEHIHKLYTAMFSDKHAFVGFGETVNGTFEDFVKGYAGTLAEDITFYKGRHGASLTVLNEVQDNRDSVSGVVMDEEVTNMMMYNKSFQAASRLMTTLDEALDVLINKTGLVGR